ncbi:MAG: TetR/AcrR family transcriptional regulator [Bacillota bacterium]
MNRKRNQPTNRDQVIQTAAQMFLTGGYAYTSMDDVMRESRVSKSNIYYHFKSKEELLLAVVEFWADTYEAQLFAILGQNGLTVEERILAFMESLAIGFTERNHQGGCPFVSLYLQCSEQAEAVRERISRFFVELSPLLTKLFAQGVNKQEFRRDVSDEEAASLFIASLEGSLVLADTTRDAGVIKRTAVQFCRMLR